MAIAIDSEAGGVQRVLVVDDHELLAHALSATLNNAGYAARPVAGEEVANAVDVAAEFEPDLVLLDIDLGHGLDGRDLIEPLNDLGTIVVLLTGSADDAGLGLGYERGAQAALLKDLPFDALIEAIRKASSSDDAFASERHRCVSELRRTRRHQAERQAPFDRLTTRERQVLQGLMRGHSAGAIAESSYVSLSTVRSQIRSVLTKLGVSSQLAAVALAREAGFPQS